MNASDEARFENLYESTSRRLYAYLRRHAGPDVAESVLAETYVKAWKHLDRIKGEPMGWLITTARRTLLDHHRASQRRDRLNDSLFDVARHSMQDTPESVVVEKQTLLEAVRKLPLEDREALLLVGWDGLDHASAARVLGCSLAAFTKRLERARRRLSDLVDVSVADAPRLRAIPRKA